MKKEFALSVAPEVAFDSKALENLYHDEFGVSSSSVLLNRRSIDARGKKVTVHLTGTAFIDEPPPAGFSYRFEAPNVSNREEVIIIGSGPAGLFAALRLIELGLKPIVIERGKDVRGRRRDIAALNKQHLVDPNSNYCFGEGGAGTFSDGKLYTRSTKRGNVGRILQTLVFFGAKQEILFDAHPHLGTNKLPPLITRMREAIVDSGGEVHFERSVTDLIVEGGRVKAVELDRSENVPCKSVILATGHSARDIFRMLAKRNVTIEPKPFSMGLRVEHPQSLIDRVQYHCDSRGDYLPAASYRLAHNTKMNDQPRGVFSFCMCPGGFIVPAATEPGEIVVNGMSPSRRDSRFANSGIVVSIENEDVPESFSGPLAAMKYQQSVERLACELAGKTQSAPAQRLQDYLDGRTSTNLPDCSYQPGLTSVDLWQVLPRSIASRLAIGLKAFGKKMKGFATNDAVLVGVESRTSSPVRIPRDPQSLQHIEVKGLFPCGEGAGYAGGIVSAAMDGVRVAEKCFESMGKTNPTESVL